MSITSNSPTTLATALRAGIRRLQPTSSSARLDAEILLAAALGRPRSHLIAYADDPLDAESAARFDLWLERRAAGIPVAYLTGHKEFWSLDLEVTADVLTPRPETELLVEQALQFLPAHRPMSVLDLGTGSGAIALAIARERPATQVIATDRSPGALEIARRNAVRLNVGNVSFLSGDWYAALGSAKVARFDLIVSNPPYIAADDAALQTPELQAEPITALSSGPTGLEDLERIAAGVQEYLVPKGWLMVEHGAGQGPAVAALFAHQGLRHIATVQDFAGHDRITRGQRV